MFIGKIFLMEILKTFLKNNKGQQVIEVLIALFLAGFFISGLKGFYQYTGDFQKVKDFMIAENHFTFIQNIFSQNCDSFVGDTLTYSSYINHNPMKGQDPSKVQITMKKSEPPYDHKLLSATSDIGGHLLSSHPDIAIKEMSLKKITSDYSLFKVVFESVKTFDKYEKTIKLYMNIGSNDIVTDCSLKPILPCAEQKILIDYVWEERDASASKKYKCFATKKKEVKSDFRKLKSGWLQGGQALPGETVSLTDSSSPCCICLIQLKCSEGFWSQFSDCFKRKGECVFCPPGTKWDSVSHSCSPITLNCQGGKIFDFNTKTCKCPPGYSWVSSQCVICTGGQILNSALDKCECPNGKPHWNGSQCISCAGKPPWNPSTKICECPSGKNWDGSICVTCLGGKIWDSSTKTCKNP